MTARIAPGGGLLDQRYRLLEVMGTSRAGRVYKALHVGLDALVVLRELNTARPTPRPLYEHARESFFAEARQWTSLSHPGVARVTDYFSHADACFLVTDYIEGDPLDVYLRSCGQLPTRATLGYGLQLCDAVAYLHRQTPPVVLDGLHLPDIVVTREGRVVLVDLGAARHFVQRLEQVDEHSVLSGAACSHNGRDRRIAGSPRHDLTDLGNVLRILLVDRRRTGYGNGPKALHEADPRRPSVDVPTLGSRAGAQPGNPVPYGSADELAAALRAAARLLVSETPFEMGLGSGASSEQATIHDGTQPHTSPRIDPARPPTGASNESTTHTPRNVLPQPLGPVRRAPPAHPAVSDLADQPTSASLEPGAGLAGGARRGGQDVWRQRRMRRALLGIGAAAAAMAAVFAAALALTLVSGQGATAGTAPHSGASTSKGVSIVPTAAPQQANGQLVGPPSSANPPVRQSVRSIPPTPTPRPAPTRVPTADPTSIPTSIPMPTVVPTPVPTSTPPPVPTGTPVPTATPTASPTPTGVPAPAPTPQSTGIAAHTHPPLHAPCPTAAPSGTAPSGPTPPIDLHAVSTALDRPPLPVAAPPSADCPGLGQPSWGATGDNGWPDASLPPGAWRGRLPV